MTAVRLLLAVALLAQVAHAQTPSDADRLFEEGRAFSEAGNHADACTKFAQSYRLDPAVGTKLNLGDCQEHLRKLLEALQLFEEAAAELERQGEAKRAAFARDRTRALLARLVTVIVKPAESRRAGLRIEIAGRAVTPASEMRVIVEPGTIPIVASVPERPRFFTSVTATGGASVTVEIPRFDTSIAVAEPTRRKRSRVQLAWGLGAGGVAGALAAGILTLKARSDYTGITGGAHCTSVAGGVRCDESGQASIRDAQHLADIGTVFAATSVVLMTAAVVLYVTAPSEHIVVTPVVITDGAAVIGRVTF